MWGMCGRGSGENGRDIQGRWNGGGGRKCGEWRVQHPRRQSVSGTEGSHKETMGNMY